MAHAQFDCAAISLHVKADNQAAIRMYEKHKFRVILELPDHYFFHDTYHDALELELRYERPSEGTVLEALGCVIL